MSFPRKAGIYNCLKVLDSHLRGNDINGPNSAFYASIIVGIEGSEKAKKK
jgi:hypothetical protein